LVNGTLERPMQIGMKWLGMVRKFGQTVGPYLMLEMLLPGGTLLALLFFLWQRRKSDSGWGAQRVVVVVMRTLAGALEQCCLVPAPIRLTARAPKSGAIERQ
jgi:hypothetical protein